MPAGPLAAALEALAAQGGVRIVAAPDVVADKQARAISGRMRWQDALERLLQGSGLDYRQDGDTTVIVALAQDGAVPVAQADAAQPSASASAATQLETITVTGTRIRGGAVASPLVSIDAAQIRAQGFADIGEVIRSIPQNFAGGQNPGVAAGATLGSGGFANQNLTGGSSLNLRGLGPDATLTLLNGRRMSYGGYVQAVDIDAIPIEAVQRIEIVPDGASAIYGSDAVGGVGNVILKRDFDGVVAGTRYGGATEGGLTTREYTLTAGTQWNGGGAIFTYKDVSTDPIYAAQRGYTRQILAPTTIYPGSDLKSGLLSLHHAFGDVAELRLDALGSRRDQVYNYYYSTSRTSYNRMLPETSALLVSPGIAVFLPNDWTLSLAATRGKDDLDNRDIGVTVATGASTARTRECLCNEHRSYEASLEGPLLTLPGGELRLATGAGYRRNAFEYSNQLTGRVSIDAQESSRFAYAELNAPLLGPASGVAAVHRLELTAALRNEDYDSFGSVTTPKLGLIYAPGADVTFKASWGRSFKAPTLYQRYAASFAQLVPVSYVSGTGYAATATALIQGGGNRDLQPERAQTRTASLAFHPQAAPGLEAELTWFRIHYTDRVVQPITNAARSLADPNYAPFIVYAPTQAELAAVMATAQNIYNSTGSAYDPSQVVALVRFGYTNVAAQEIEGLDLSGSYDTQAGNGHVSVQGAVSWLDSTQKTSPLQRPFDVAGTLFNPARVSGRLGAVWSPGAVSWSLFGNYRSGVTNTVDDTKTASFTTFDTTLRYALDRPRGVLAGVEVALAAQNIFDRRPPLYTPASWIHVPYDSTNYSAVGRFLSLSLSKRF
ncbi:TonB-dependent receptor [Xanthomonas campestris pv. phormiicola]|nr:TonB-dependent receptor [Xanthomonas campestris pv. phormiicola]UYC15968.1 TonB-dependent receptor [Xanthomonas campestris pv. phormiicola]